jgi:NhaP-type Na+/H+ or K+/H+ antiporter
MRRANQNWRSSLITSLMILVSIVTIGWLQRPQLEKLQANNSTVSAEQIRRDTEAEKVRLSLLQQAPSLGFDNLIADWTFLNFLQYFGDEPARQKTDYSLSPDFFEVILKRDPYFISAYTFLSTSTSLYAGLPERSTSIMKTALQSLKPNVPADSYIAWRQLGIDQLLFTGDAQAARQSFLTAAQWAAQSSLPESREVASLSQQTADFLATNPDSKTAQVAAWVMVLTNAPDEQTRKTAIQKIEALGGKVIVNPDGTVGIQQPAHD